MCPSVCVLQCVCPGINICRWEGGGGGGRGGKGGGGGKGSGGGEGKKRGKGQAGVDTKEGGGESVDKKSNKIKGVVNKKPDALQFHQVDVAAMRNKKGSKSVKKK